MAGEWQAVSDASGVTLATGSARPQSGGSISSAWRLDSDHGPVFVKLESAQHADRLAAEADGLAALADADAVRVPGVLAQGVAGGQAYLILEWLQRGPGNNAAARLGEKLAAQHGLGNQHFGWRRDNYIGATQQPNGETDDWVSFLREHRLGYQFDLARSHGHRFDERRVSWLLDGLGHFYRDYRPAVSLLHGDLWGGNWFSDEHGEPVIFDPAVYCGDREADLAMTELFGGFGREFYAAYDSAWPLDPGYNVRRDLHKLYHVLNHLNLFGGGYKGQASALLDTLCSELA